MLIWTSTVAVLDRQTASCDYPVVLIRVQTCWTHELHGMTIPLSSYWFRQSMYESRTTLFDCAVVLTLIQNSTVAVLDLQSTLRDYVVVRILVQTSNAGPKNYIV